MLEHDDGISACGTGAPVMISQTAPRGSGPGEVSGAGRAGDGERAMRGNFRGAAGEAVARGAGEGRLVASARRARENAARGLAEGNALDGGPRGALQRCGDQRCGLVVAEQSGTH